MMRLSLGYPDEADEELMLARFNAASPPEDIRMRGAAAGG